ncbi:MAG: hypothetical protein ACLFOY_05850 [Desulfatibacillaceae bacterium]
MPINYSIFPMGRGFFWGLLFACCILRFGIVWAFVHDWLPLTIHDGWHFLYGKDYLEYFGIAKSFSQGELGSGQYPAGYPLFLTPFVFAFDATQWMDIATPVAMAQSVFMAGGAILLLGWLGYVLTGQRVAGVIAAFSWTVIPLAAYAFFGLFGEAAQILRAINVPSLIWARMYSEPLASMLILLAMSLWIVGDSYRLQVVGAIFVGMAFLVREDAIVFIVIGCVYWIWVKDKGWRSVLVLGAMVTAIYSIQFLYNYLLTDNPFMSPHFKQTAAYAKEASLPQWSVENVLFLVRYTFAKPLFLLIALSCVALSLSVLFPWKRDRFDTWFLPLALLYGYPVFYSFYGATRTDFVRFLMPVYFSLALASGALATRIAEWWLERRREVQAFST